MNICGNTCHMDCNGHRNCLMARYNWCNFGKLSLMLGFGQRKHPLLPFVIGLFTHAIFFTPAFHSQSAIPAFRDPPGPHSQLVLLIQLLQFSTHNKNTPISRIVHASRVYYPLLYESIVSLYLSALKPLLALTVTLPFLPYTISLVLYSVGMKYTMLYIELPFS